MAEIDIDRKNWDALESARKIRDALVERESYPEWLSPADVVGLTGLPKHLAERGLKCLAGLTGAAVRVRDTVVEFQVDNLDAVPGWAELPDWLQSVRARAMQLWPRIGDSAVGLFVFVLLAFLSVGWLQAGGLLARELGPVVEYPYSAVAYGLLLIAVVWTVFLAVLAGLLVVPIGWMAYNWLWGGIVAPLVGAPLPAGAPEGSEYITMWFAAGLIFGVGYLLLTKLRHAFAKFWEAAAAVVQPLWCFDAVGRDDLWGERQFVGLLEATEGVIELGDVMILYGWTWNRAFEEMTRLMVDYGGDVQVDEHGQITYHFEMLARKLDAAATDTPRPIWEKNSPREAFERENNILLECGLAVMFGTLALPWIWALVSGFDLSGFLAQLDGWQRLVGGVSGTLMVVSILGFLVGRRLWVRSRDRAWRRNEPLFDWLERFDRAGGTLYLDPDEIDDSIIQKLDARIDTSDVDRKGRVLVEVPALR